MIKSIARSLIDRNIDRRFTVKLLFSQKPKPIRLVAGGGLIGYIKTMSSLNIKKAPMTTLGSKIGFKLENCLNPGVLHLWSKFGDPRLARWLVIAQTNSGLANMDTDAGNDNAWRPKLGWGKKNRGADTM